MKAGAVVLSRYLSPVTVALVGSKNRVYVKEGLDRRKIIPLRRYYIRGLMVFHISEREIFQVSCLLPSHLVPSRPTGGSCLFKSGRGLDNPSLTV